MTEDIQRSLGRIEGTQKVILKALERIHDDHDKTKERVNDVEKKSAYVAGATAMVVGGFVVGVKALWDLFTS